MTVDVLLSKLERVRKTGAGRWLARCPAHDDKGPSLSVRELPDGRVLVHDFAGCETEEVLSALDLTFADLMPERIGGAHIRPRERRPFSAHDILAAVAFEAIVVAVSAENLAAGVELGEDELDRLVTAAARLRNASELANA